MNIKKFAPWNWFKKEGNENGYAEKEYSISMEIPGVSKKEISIELLRNTLVIRGEKKQTHEDKNKNYYRIERSYGAFQRTLSLPADADESRVDARFKNGILKITIPRLKTPTSRVNQIEVKYA
ncbi:Hsp20/alpha crystallin family protein [Desulfobacter curvatus]|uniref:Hsp20/alpha crystallin family protein n=1 Tax=Desulfobacter curvatus TaxID=2290 RepID=UPI00035D2A55|nr:Hsp20/alpha crystallin family protein [Desulfobacter curvatus]